MAAGLPGLPAEADLPVRRGPGRSGSGLPRRLLLVRPRRQPAQTGVARQVPQIHRGSRERAAHPSANGGERPDRCTEGQKISNYPEPSPGSCLQVFLSLVQGTNLIQRLINVAYTYDNLGHRCAGHRGSLR